MQIAQCYILVDQVCLLRQQYLSILVPSLCHDEVLERGIYLLKWAVCGNRAVSEYLCNLQQGQLILLFR